MTPTIEAAGLRKRFGKTVALDGLDTVNAVRDGETGDAKSKGEDEKACGEEKENR